MKKSRLFAIIIFVCLALAVAGFFNMNSSLFDFKASERKNTVKISKQKFAKSFKDEPKLLDLPKQFVKRYSIPTQLDQPSLDIPAPLETFFQNETNECLEFWKTILEMDLSLFRNSADSVVPLPAKCKPSKAMAAIHEYYIQLCSADREKLSPEENIRRCYAGLVFYRAKIEADLYSKIQISAISDRNILTSLLLGNAFENPKRAMLAADRLLQLDPSFYPAAKASALFKSALANSPVEIASAKESIKAALDISMEDQEPFEVTLANLRLAENPTTATMKELGDKFTSQIPNSGYGPYLYAMAAFKEGHFIAFKQFLAQAMQTNPSNQDFNFTNEEINKIDAKTLDPNLKIFRLSQVITIDELID